MAILKKVVYVTQPSGFEDTELPNYVLKVDKSLQGLKQAPPAMYKRLSKFLLTNEVTKGKVDITLLPKT